MSKDSDNHTVFVTSMKHHHTNDLSQVRKEHHLQLTDVARILNVDIGLLSRQESGLANPSLATIIGYTILFDTSVHQLFKEDYLKHYEEIMDRLLLFKEQLEEAGASITKPRLQSLDAILNRLMPDELYYDHEEG